MPLDGGQAPTIAAIIPLYNGTLFIRRALESVFNQTVAPTDVIVVDDGMATGLTMRAAVIALRQRGARQIIAAAPTASESACRDVETVADDLVCLEVPPQFIAVGQWYRDFSQTSDEEVRELLARAAKRVESGSPERKRMV